MRRDPWMFLADESGGTAIEYGMICALIFMVVVGSITTFADRTTDMYNLIASKM